ncbi:MAG: NADH-quinone oxidoreductase subunit J [Spirochaetia bacterium]|nr:NADH-quinone oxidoreductase subunit J [Spirochaetia bacterium]
METSSLITFIKPFVFYTFASLAVISAIMVIVSRNPLNSAVMLVLTFFSIAAVYALMGSEVIAVFQILVYAGAIMVLVIFVIMFLNLRPSNLKIQFNHIIRSGIAIVFMLIMFIATMSLLTEGVPFYMANAAKGDITQAVLESQGAFQLFSRALFTEYLLPFELTSLLLTVAIIGVVVLIRGITNTVATKKENFKTKGDGK